MHTAPKQVLTLLLSVTLAVPMATAQTTSLDGDWEGTWRCEATDGAGASTSPAIATISGARIKLSRAADASDMVLNGTIGADGTVTVGGRGTGPDGQPILSNFSGTVSVRSLTASGRAMPLAGGAVQTCALALTPISIPTGPTVLRGSGAPSSDGPAPAVGTSAPPDDASASTTVWYDNDFYWRRHRLLRWEHRRRVGDRRRHHDLPVCEQGQIVSPGTCRSGPPNAIGPTPPPRTERPPTPTTPPATGPATSSPRQPQVVGSSRTAPQGSTPPAAIGPTPPPTGATQGTRPIPAPANNPPSASIGRPAAPAPSAQGPTPSRSTGFGPPACGSRGGIGGRC